MVAPAKALPGVQPSRPTLLLVGLTTGHMVNDFYGTILPPLIPALKDTFTLNYAQVGVLSFCFYILSGILQPAIGHLADKHARRKQAILAGLLIFCAGFVAMGFASSYGFVLAASLLCGLGAASFHPQSTNFLTRAFPQTKGRIMGIHGWGGSIGNFLAPMVMALLIVHFGWRQGLMFLVIPGVLVVLFLRRLLDEPQDRQLASFGKGITRDLLFVALAFWLFGISRGN